MSLAALEAAAVHKANGLTAFLGTFIGLGGLAIGQEFLNHMTLLGTESPMIFAASFGALATLLYGAPAAPLGRISNTLFGHILSIAIALIIHHGVKPFVSMPMEVEKVLTPSLAIGAMVHFGVTHPPAAACVVLYSTLDDQRRQSPIYLLFPALVGALYMLAVQLALAAAIRRFGPDSGSAAKSRGWMWAQTIESSGVLTAPKPSANGKGANGKLGSMSDVVLALKPELRSTSSEFKSSMPQARLRELLGESFRADADELDELRATHPGLSTEELRRELQAVKLNAGIASGGEAAHTPQAAAAGNQTRVSHSGGGGARELV